jgi:two-component system, sensor histidine kinase RegB
MDGPPPGGRDEGGRSAVTTGTIQDRPSSGTLAWLRQVRWAAVVGQSATVAYVSLSLKVALPVAAVFGCIGVTAASNILLHFVPAGRGERQAILAGILAVDVVNLTIILNMTGGPHNPFSSFYLAHVALAAVALSTGWTLALACLCGVGYWLLFQGPHAIHRYGGAGGDDMSLALHLQGMFVAFLLTSASIVFFASRLQQALRRRDVELENARAAAVQNEHFAALATLAAGAAHELGSPLGTIFIAAGEVARAARSLPGQADLLDDAELIREEAERCRVILDKLQQQAGDTPRRLGVRDLVDGVASRFAGVRLNVRMECPDAAVVAPPEALAQALAALVKNAADASPAGASVDVTLRSAGTDVEFAVIDHGTGLSPEAASHAGEPFFTTKGPGRGTGLGLFLVKLLARRLNGDFTLESGAAGGVRAALRLPRAQ